ncbi:MAG: protein-L-isoaspartate(D-aspartate) O-methyltransferase [Candidatus Eisenbacteria bacterium]
MPLELLSRTEANRLAEERRRMVAEQIVSRGVKDPLVLAAMRSVPRHEFVPDDMVTSAHRDAPLPIGSDQTISQPYIVALMTEAIRLEGGEHVLEVGTGSGYQAAVLAEIAGHVDTVEIHADLAREAAERLARLGYTDAAVHHGDGYGGLPASAPFDAIVVAAAPDHVPRTLLDQLKVGGRLVLPVGRRSQMLQLWTRTERDFEARDLIPVQFVPMTGEARREPSQQT